MATRKKEVRVEIYMTGGVIAAYGKTFTDNPDITAIRAYFDLYDWFYNKTSPAFTIHHGKGLEVITRSNIIRMLFIDNK